MYRGLIVAPMALVLAAALACAISTPVHAADRALENALGDQVRVLASDDFGGREPGTEGETKTLRYLARQWFDVGLVSGTNDPGNPWFAPVELIGREPAAFAATFMRNKAVIAASPDDILLLTSGQRNLVENAPLLFVGYGSGPLPSRMELAGRIAVIFEVPQTDAGEETQATPEDRPGALIAGGASAVLTILGPDRQLTDVAARRSRYGYALAGEGLGGDLEGFVSRGFAAKNLKLDLGKLEAEAARPGFIPHPLGVTASREATTRETRISTHNLIGKLPGRRPGTGAVLIVAHWDHFGTCAQPPAENLICNGAIDNASGLAVMTEVARALARGRAPDRDVYFLATTAEELGLLGAHAFAENPPLPLDQIVAAFNIDSPALGREGQPLTIIGRGRTVLDRDIARVATKEKRKVADSPAADMFMRRQDGWALLQHDIPAVMVSSSYWDSAEVERFMDQTYHRPSDEWRTNLSMGAAAEAVGLHIALLRWFGSVKDYPGSARIPG